MRQHCFVCCFVYFLKPQSVAFLQNLMFCFYKYYEISSWPSGWSRRRLANEGCILTQTLEVDAFLVSNPVAFLRIDALQASIDVAKSACCSYVYTH